MVARTLLRNSVSIEEWLAPTTSVKYCSLKNFSLRLITRKKYFLGTTTLLWITVFSYESFLIISLRFSYNCKTIKRIQSCSGVFIINFE